MSRHPTTSTTVHVTTTIPTRTYQEQGPPRRARCGSGSLTASRVLLARPGTSPRLAFRICAQRPATAHQCEAHSLHRCTGRTGPSARREATMRPNHSLEAARVQGETAIFAVDLLHLCTDNVPLNKKLPHHQLVSGRLSPLRRGGLYQGGRVY